MSVSNPSLTHGICSFFFCFLFFLSKLLKDPRIMFSGSWRLTRETSDTFGANFSNGAKTGPFHLEVSQNNYFIILDTVLVRR